MASQSIEATWPVEARYQVETRLIVPFAFKTKWALAWYDGRDPLYIRVVPLYPPLGTEVEQEAEKKEVEESLKANVQRELKRGGVTVDLKEAKVEWWPHALSPFLSQKIFVMVAVNQMLTTELNRPEHCFTFRDLVKSEQHYKRVMENIQCCLAAGSCVVNLMGDIRAGVNE